MFATLCLFNYDQCDEVRVVGNVRGVRTRGVKTQRGDTMSHHRYTIRIRKYTQMCLDFIFNEENKKERGQRRRGYSFDDFFAQIVQRGARRNLVWTGPLDGVDASSLDGVSRLLSRLRPAPRDDMRRKIDERVSRLFLIQPFLSSKWRTESLK